MKIRRALLALTLVLALLAAWAQASETTTHPFVGVTHVARTETKPRPLAMHVVIVDLKAPGLRFLLTPHQGPKDTLKETTLQFLTRQKAQVAVNVHFFSPWPAPDPDPGVADLLGLAASEGRVYSPFDTRLSTPTLFSGRAVGLNIDAHNRAGIVHRKNGDRTGRLVAEPVKLHNAMSGNKQILTQGKNTAGTSEWDETLNPRTVVGLAPKDKLVLLLVDGRQPGVSEGMTLREIGDLLRRDYGVTDALNLDGGGSTTLCLADPAPRIANVPVGIGNIPGSQRPVGSNLAIFAALSPSPPTPRAP
jgi:hypothetical protein